MERCPKCRTKYDPSYTVSCSNCGALLVDFQQTLEVPAGFESAGNDETEAANTWDRPETSPGASATRRLAPFARWIVAGLVILGGLIANFITDARRDDTGTIVDQGSIDVTEARVGDCIDLREEDLDADVIEEFVGVPCTAPHQMEVYALFDHEGGAGFPGRSVLEEYATDGCAARFGDFTGAPYETEPVLDFNYFIPVEEGWSQGDREIACTVIAYDGSNLVGSMRGLGIVHYQSLTVGCYDLPAGSDSGFWGMHPRSCDDVHDVEVFSAAVEPSGPEAPFDDAALVEWGDATCQAEYEHYLGSGAEDPELTWWYFYPSEASWAEGDRSFTCYLQRVDEQPLTAAYKGSA